MTEKREKVPQDQGWGSDEAQEGQTKTGPEGDQGAEPNRIDSLVHGANWQEPAVSGGRMQWGDSISHLHGVQGSLTLKFPKTKIPKD